MRILRADGESESSSRHSMSCSLMSFAGDICPSVRREALSKKRPRHWISRRGPHASGAQFSLFLAGILIVLFVRQQPHSLPFEEPLVDTIRSLDKFFMTALLDHCALFENKDAVEHPHRGEPVRNHNRRPANDEPL